MRLSRTRGRLDPASIRLPLIALIDVVLFLLLYFMFAGTLAAEEGQLASALRTERGSPSRAQDLQPQFLHVEPFEGKDSFRVGERRLADRESLRQVLDQLPKDNGVIVRVAPAASVAGVAAAIQVCRDAGFQKISYVPGK